jgi:hypothetical protein
MAKIHVLLKKEELDAQRLPGKTVVVLDILFATSSIVAALAHGAAEVIPRSTARRRRPRRRAIPGRLLRALRRAQRRDPARLRAPDAARHLLAENLAGDAWCTPPPTARWRSPSRAAPTTSMLRRCSTARRW